MELKSCQSKKTKRTDDGGDKQRRPSKQQKTGDHSTSTNTTTTTTTMEEGDSVLTSLEFFEHGWGCKDALQVSLFFYSYYINQSI